MKTTSTNKPTCCDSLLLIAAQRNDARDADPYGQRQEHVDRQTACRVVTHMARCMARGNLFQVVDGLLGTKREACKAREV